MIDGRQTLDELLGEPMIQLLMERDRVRPEEVRMLLERARSRTEEQLVPPPHAIAPNAIAKMCVHQGLCA